MSEITGQLIGGPEDGNLITSSVSSFPVISSNELWLDGHELGKVASVTVTIGTYTWDADKGYFKWNLSETNHFEKQYIA